MELAGVGIRMVKFGQRRIIKKVNCMDWVAIGMIMEFNKTRKNTKTVIEATNAAGR